MPSRKQSEKQVPEQQTSFFSLLGEEGTKPEAGNLSMLPDDKPITPRTPSTAPMSDEAYLQMLLGKREPVAPHIVAVLAQSSVQGNALILPGQLERKTYLDTNKVIERIGGKWNKKAKAHLFEEDENPQELLQLVIQTGEMPPHNPTAFYESPEPLAAMLAEAIPAHAARILEPSAGRGAIARAIRAFCDQHHITATLECCEIIEKFEARLQAQGFPVVARNFLTYQPVNRYDAILMNPPYAVLNDALAYITHIEHAWTLLAEGGVLKAIVPAGFTFRQDKRTMTLRSLVETVGEWEELPDGSFKESGTGVRTVVLTMWKS